MGMQHDQVRTALAELNGLRDVRIRFGSPGDCLVRSALLVPVEDDGLIKLTDGATEYVVDADRIVWIEIGPPTTTR
ncbi:MAG: hypothetical protein QF733_01115 [Phycisphaerales bacterium]|jgi:hypothetical protein|nr:hypothetical protein [Phycisphaerales bacterium]